MFNDVTGTGYVVDYPYPHLGTMRDQFWDENEAYKYLYELYEDWDSVHGEA